MAKLRRGDSSAIRTEAFRAIQDTRALRVRPELADKIMKLKLLHEPEDYTDYHIFRSEHQRLSLNRHHDLARLGSNTVYSEFYFRLTF